MHDRALFDAAGRRSDDVARCANGHKLQSPSNEAVAMLSSGAGTGRDRRLDIQGLRAIAVLMVVAFHAGLPVPGGFVGVDVFFVISGFVITAMLRREWIATGHIRLGNFYVRRFKRLTPALALMVSVTVGLSILIQSFHGAQQSTADTAIGAMFLIANAVIAQTTGGYFDDPAEHNPLLNTWSLSVEEQFYLLFPIVLFTGWLLVRKYHFLRNIPSLLVGLVAAASFAWAELGSSGASISSDSFLVGFYSPLTRAWEFAAGALLAMSASALKPKLIERCRATRLGLVGFVLLAASVFLIRDFTPFPGVWTLLPVVGTLLLLAAGLDGSNMASRILATAPMVKVGDWSYSIYLWHWPFIVFAALLWPGTPLTSAVAALLSLVPAAASFRWVEQPIRSFVPQSRKWLAGLVLSSLLPPLALATLLAVGASAQWWVTAPLSVASKQEIHVALSRGCVDQPFDPDLCQWGSNKNNGTVFLVGDSQAYAIADGVIEAASRLGYATIVSSRSACPFVAAGYIWPANSKCELWQKQVLDFAVETRPVVVVIANRSAGYVNPEWRWAYLAKFRSQRASSIAEASAVWERALSEVVTPLHGVGVRVLIINPIPDVNDRIEPSSLLQVWGHANPRSRQIRASTEEALRARSPADRAEQAVAQRTPGVVLYDPIPQLCTDRECPRHIDGVSLYLDWGHLTPAGALLLAPSLAGAIQAASR